METGGFTLKMKHFLLSVYIINYTKAIDLV